MHTMWGQFCFNAGPLSSMVTYIRSASAWRLVVACADPVLHPDLTYSVLLCSYPAGCGGVCCAIHSCLLSLCLSSGSSLMEEHVFFHGLRLIFY